MGRLPTLSQLEEWKYDLITNVLLTSARPDNSPVAWIKEVDESWANEDYLRESGEGWYQLDQKLAGALLPILPVALKRKVKTAQKMEMNTMMKVVIRAMCSNSAPGPGLLEDRDAI